MLRMDMDDPTGKTCNQRQVKKMRHKLVDVECGSDAIVVIKFIDEFGETQFSLPLCRDCLGKTAKEMVSTVVAFF